MVNNICLFTGALNFYSYFALRLLTPVFLNILKFTHNLYAWLLLKIVEWQVTHCDYLMTALPQRCHGGNVQSAFKWILAQSKIQVSLSNRANEGRLEERAL